MNKYMHLEMHTDEAAYLVVVNGFQRIVLLSMLDGGVCAVLAENVPSGINVNSCAIIKCSYDFFLSKVFMSYVI